MAKNFQENILTWQEEFDQTSKLYGIILFIKNEVIPSLVIHVGKDYIQVKDSTIDPKSVWKPSDNFINATDESGNTLPFTKVTVEVTK